MATESDVRYVLTAIAGWLGTRSWGARADQSGSLTIELGNSLPPTRHGNVHGEWHLWASFCDWRIEQDGRVIAGSGDSEIRRQTAAQQLNGRLIQDIQLTAPVLDAAFSFEGGLALRLFCVHSEEYESWQLFLPDNRVLIVGPGERWILQSSQEPYPSYL